CYISDNRRCERLLRIVSILINIGCNLSKKGRLKRLLQHCLDFAQFSLLILVETVFDSGDLCIQLKMDVITSCKDLIDRIIAVLSDERVSGMWSKKNAVGKEEVAKLVDDIYRCAYL
ncbi:E3 SUMO-protein ligase SIZ1-like protein, partial [Tanacetum coccineum]